jgi:hypothetical protein
MDNQIPVGTKWHYFKAPHRIGEGQILRYSRQRQIKENLLINTTLDPR